MVYFKRILIMALILPVGFCVVAAGCGTSDNGNGDPDAGCKEEDRYRFEFGPADTTFHVGPYQEHTTQTLVSFGWETLEAGSTLLEYGPDANYGQTVNGDPGTMHQVVIEGLSPATTYHYRACTDSTCTGDLQFSTAPEKGQPFRFAVYGDCQDGPEAHEQVIEQLIGDEANLVVVVGDTVSDGNFREQFKERYFDPARRFAQRAPRYAAVGNHDRKDTDVVHFIDYHIFPEDPGVPQAETSYSFVYGDAFFLVFDNTLDHYDFFFPLGDTEQPLWTWLNEQVQSEAAQNARWRFAFAHYPADSICREEDYVYSMPESAVREYVVPLLRDHGFQGYFAGHVHCYERFDFDGLLVITTGGGGGGLESEEICTRPVTESRTHRCVHHHTLVDIGCEDAQVWARDYDGNLIERLALHPDGSHERLP